MIYFRTNKPNIADHHFIKERITNDIIQFIKSKDQVADMLSVH